MQKEGKFWGTTSPIFMGNNVEVHRIVGKIGCYCSEHKHNSKFNMFFIESGKFAITTWKDGSGKPDYTYLSNGDSCVVPPGYFHKFEVLESGVAYEIYWTELRSDDIVRRFSGGTNVKTNDGK